jgi:hypothetical protein
MADEKCPAVSAAGRVAQLFWCSLFSVEGVPRAFGKAFNCRKIAKLEAGCRYATLYGAIAPYAAIQAQNFHTPSYNETDAIPGGFALAFPARDAQPGASWPPATSRCCLTMARC